MSFKDYFCVINFSVIELIFISRFSVIDLFLHSHIFGRWPFWHRQLFGHWQFFGQWPNFASAAIQSLTFDYSIIDSLAMSAFRLVTILKWQLFGH